MPPALRRTVFVFAGFLAALALLVALRNDFRLGPAPRPNIVVIMVDTLRADHLGVYGYQRDTSPSIDALALRGTVFTAPYSVSNWTNPAIKSMFTGLDPQAVMPEASHDEAMRMPLPLSVETFAELLKTRGYGTAALVDHPGIRPWGNFDQGFDSYTMLYEEGAPSGLGWAKSDTDYVAEQFGARIDEDPETPFLIYLHVVYPHRPYTPMGEYGGMFGPDGYDDYVPEQREMLLNAYDAEVKRTDDLVALLHDALARRELLDDTWVLLTSDHGEGFWEHSFAEHGNVFYDEMIKVPMILVPPRGDLSMPARLDTPVSNLDVFATILDIASVDPPAGTGGRSLLDSDTWADTSRSLFSESPHKYDIHGRAIIRGGMKYMHYPGRPAGQRDLLFDLQRDPREQTNLFGARPDLQAGLQDLLEEHRQLAAVELEKLTQTTVEPDDETLERLRALGYIR